MDTFGAFLTLFEIGEWEINLLSVYLPKKLWIRKMGKIVFADGFCGDDRLSIILSH